jgi:hypothetical protein
MCTCATVSYGQMSLVTSGVPVVATFDATLAGVNNGTFVSTVGVTSTPGVGELDSDAFAFTGFSNGSVAFGGSNTGSDYRRGTSGGGVSTGGMYAFDVDNTAGVSRAIGIQPSSSDMTPGSMKMRVQNNTGSVLDQIDISYDLCEYNDQTQSMAIYFSHSADDNYYKSEYADDHETVYTAGAATWTTTTHTISITGLNIPNGGFYYFRWTVADVSSGSRDEFAFDNISVTGTAGTCILAAQPTTDATNITFPRVTNNGFTINWNNGDGANRIVVVRASSAVVGPPVDQSTYLAFPEIGNTSTIAASEHVVYNGTGNSVDVAGLAASTTYHVAVYEYNGGSCEENYLTSAPATSSVSTDGAGTAICPQIATAIINSCNGVCSSEGFNEFVILSTGSYFLPVDRDADMVFNPIFYYGTSSPASSNFSQGFTQSSSILASLNAATGGCATTVFVDALSTYVIPAGANFMIVSDNMCTPSDYDYSGFCGNGPIYVFFSQDKSWVTGGNFSHTVAATRYFRTDFGAALGGGCLIDYDYDVSSLLLGTDGDYATWAGGGSAATYGNDACAFAASVLPIELIRFEARKCNGNVCLTWATASELDNDYFTIEKTLDGITFEDVAIIDGAGESNSVIEYSSIDENPYPGISYYRLKQTDTDGEKTYSELEAVNFNNELGITIYPNPNSGHSIMLEVEDLKEWGEQFTLHLTDQLGRIVMSQTYSSEISTPIEVSFDRVLPKGIYLITIESGAQFIHEKLIIR